MRPGRTTLAAAAALVLGALGAPAASADVTVTQTDSPDPVDRGGTVTVQTTITNNGAAEPDLHAQVGLSRPNEPTPVDDSYLSLTPSQGTCAPSGDSAECELGAVGAGASVTMTAAVRANQSFAQTVSAYICTGPSGCDSGRTFLGTGSSVTQVNYPTVFKGSNKIKLTGVPETCTTSDFKAKAKVKANKVRRTYAYLNGPQSEFGGPLPGGGVEGRIGKARKAKLKVKVHAATLDPGFYELKFAAKRKGGSQLKRSATFQVCGRTFDG